MEPDFDAIDQLTKQFLNDYLEDRKDIAEDKARNVYFILSQLSESHKEDTRFISAKRDYNVAVGKIQRAGYPNDLSIILYDMLRPITLEDLKLANED